MDEEQRRMLAQILMDKGARDTPNGPWGNIPTNPQQGQRDNSAGWDQTDYGWNPRPLGLAPFWRWPAQYRMGGNRT